MKMLLKDGTIIEGTPITNWDIDNISSITKELKSFSQTGGVYMQYGSEEKVARFLVVNYNIAKREKAIALATEEIADVEEIPDHPLSVRA